MAMDGNALGTALNTAALGVPPGSASLAAWQAVGAALVTYLTANATITLTGVTATGVTAGSASSGPMAGTGKIS